jgi:hypothetical protein
VRFLRTYSETRRVLVLQMQRLSEIVRTVGPRSAAEPGPSQVFTVDTWRSFVADLICLVDAVQTSDREIALRIKP